MIRVHSVEDEAELAVLRSLLDAEGIQYIVDNDTFGSILAGPRIAHYNAKSIMVPEDQAARVRELLTEFEPGMVESRRPLSRRGRLRVLAETVFFGWFVPGRARGRREKT